LLLGQALADRFEHGHLLTGPLESLRLAGVGQPMMSFHITFFSSAIANVLLLHI